MFWLIGVTLLVTVLTHLFYWTLTAPINKVWLRNIRLAASAQRFVGASSGNVNESDWTILRDRWERSHLYRAASSLFALFLLSVALLS
jgi:hypothetical protein